MKLSTGKLIYANHDILGIGPEADQVFEGYDGTICSLVHDEDHYSRHDDLTDEEKIEIANIAIKRWESFKEKILKA